VHAFTLFDLAADLGDPIWGVAINDATAPACVTCGHAGAGHVSMELGGGGDLVLCRSCVRVAVRRLVEDAIDLVFAARSTPPRRCPLHQERAAGRVVPVCYACATYGLVAHVNGVRPFDAWWTDRALGL